MANDIKAGRDVRISNKTSIQNTTIESTNYWRYVTDYLDFLIEFTKKPKFALRGHKGIGHIDSKLSLFAVLSVILSYAVAMTLNSMGNKNGLCFTCSDVSYLIEAFINADIKFAPFLFLVRIFFVSLVFHLLIKVIGIRIRALARPLKSTTLSDDVSFGGSIQDTVNASFSFVSFYLPYFTIQTFLYAFIISTTFPPGATITNLIESQPLGFIWMCISYLPWLYHLPSALSATHPRTQYIQALLAVFGGGAIFSSIMLLSRIYSGGWQLNYNNTNDPVLLWKGFSGASVFLFLILKTVIMNITNQKNSDKNSTGSVIIFSCYSIFLGIIGIAIPIIYNPWINYIGFPLLQVVSFVVSKRIFMNWLKQVRKQSS